MFNRRNESLSSQHMLLKFFSLYFFLNLARVAMAMPNLRGGSVVGMVKVENTGVKYSYSLVSEYQSDAYCANDSGTNGQICKSELGSDELQTTDFSSQYGSATYTYEINGATYNVKAAMDGSGLLDADNNIVDAFGACQAVVSFPSDYTLVSLNCDTTVVVGMVKILNGGEQYTFENWGAYQSNAICTDDAGINEASCKTSLASGEEQTTDLTNEYGTATYTYGINNIAYNVKVSMTESGLLDSNNNVVSTVGACTATNSYPSGYTLISIDCDSDPVPTYDATEYTDGVALRGVNFSGEEWESGSYHPSIDDCNKAKMVGFNAGRYTIDITKLSNSSGIIDWSTGEAANVDSSFKTLLTCDMKEVILDAHNTLVGPTGTADWTNGKITGTQLLTFWQQAAPRYQSYSNFAIGVVNEPHDISTNPSDAQTEANALFEIYSPIVTWFADNKITSRSYWEPSDYGGIADYANIVWQNFYANLVALSNYPHTMVADGHAYGTNTNGPGGSGYGDCQADGVTHNYLDQVASFAKKGNYSVAITEYNGDPSYTNCISYVQTTVAYMNANAQTGAGGFITNYLWAYYLNQGSGDPLDINALGEPENNAQIVAMQGYGDLIPGTLAGAPTVAPTTPSPTLLPTTTPPSVAPTSSVPTMLPTFKPTVFPTTSHPSAEPTVKPSSQPTYSMAPSGAPTIAPTHSPEAGINGILWGAFGASMSALLCVGGYMAHRYYRNKGNFCGFFQSADSNYIPLPIAEPMPEPSAPSKTNNTNQQERPSAL